MHKDSEQAGKLSKVSKLSPSLGVTFSVLPPIVSREQFAYLVGSSVDTVRGWAQTATIPTVKIGRQRLVNMARLASDLDAGKTEFCQGDYGVETDS